MLTNLKLMYMLTVIVTVLNGKELHSSVKNVSENSFSNFKLITSKVVSLASTTYKTQEKWQVGRVSRKQYEIINMLYRKTKTFVETERVPTAHSLKLSKHRNFFGKKHQQVTSVSQNPVQGSFLTVQPRSNNDRQKTPSYIEFYYLDDSDERIKRKDKDIQKNSRTNIESDEYKFALLRPPFFLFRVNDATCKPKTINYVTAFLHNKQFLTHNLLGNNNRNKSQINGYVENKHTTKIFTNKTKISHKNKITENKTLSSLLRDRFTHFVPTTPYDRIKFFEIYDSDTYKPLTLVDNKMEISNDNYIQSEEKILLDQVDHDTGNHDGYNITRFVKKHVNYNYNENKINNTSEGNVTKCNRLELVNISKKVSTNYNRPAQWSDFPFIAVYVYEPEQIRCDSASISSHWLVASATCLYRHQKYHHKMERRSAFVAYCGDNWRLPGRITYVKRSFIHPRFQTKERSRRHLYNIGVIQVVNSIAAICSGWQPISLMSHQFVAERDGTFGTAIGWGFDRYDTRYSSSDLRNYPLMLYEGLVYSDSCPGNADYSKVKGLDEYSVKNVYCLSLPPYILEENDTVHGGLLLIGGKLIALYLQEERRPWGDQSAQYTGIWRLIPWILDVAREVDDPESFGSEM